MSNFLKIVNGEPRGTTIADSDLPSITLTSDVTGSGSGGSISTTVSAIQGTSITGTTGSGKVVFSSLPTLTSAILGGNTLFSELTFNTTNPASTGAINLSNTGSIAWRNTGNTADLLLKSNASNQLVFNSDPVATVGAVNAFTGNNTMSGTLSITNSTTSSSTSTGALIVTGGTGIGGAIYAGGAINSAGTIESTITSAPNFIAQGGNSAAGGVIQLMNIASSGKFNYFIMNNFNHGNTVEITPSTAVDGSTPSSTSGWRVNQNGDTIQNGVFTANGTGSSSFAGPITTTTSITNTSASDSPLKLVSTSAGTPTISVLFSDTNGSFAYPNWQIGYGITTNGSFEIVPSSSNAGTSFPTTALRADGNLNVVVGGASLATNATNGFLYIPKCAGTPTGVPTGQTGFVPMVYDTTNHKFWIYDTGTATWKGTVLS